MQKSPNLTPARPGLRTRYVNTPGRREEASAIKRQGTSRTSRQKKEELEKSANLRNDKKIASLKMKIVAKYVHIMESEHAFLEARASPDASVEMADNDPVVVEPNDLAADMLSSEGYSRELYVYKAIDPTHVIERYDSACQSKRKCRLLTGLKRD